MNNVTGYILTMWLFVCYNAISSIILYVLLILGHLQRWSVCIQFHRRSSISTRTSESSLWHKGLPSEHWPWRQHMPQHSEVCCQKLAVNFALTCGVKYMINYKKIAVVSSCRPMPTRNLITLIKYMKPFKTTFTLLIIIYSAGSILVFRWMIDFFFYFT